MNNLSGHDNLHPLMLLEYVHINVPSLWKIANFQDKAIHTNYKISANTIVALAICSGVHKI